MSRSCPPLASVGWLLLSSVAIAQSGAQEKVEPVAVQARADDTVLPVTPPPADTPYEAYEQGRFDQALQGFTDLQVEFPEDPEVALNVGSAHYQMRNYAEADRAFSTAGLAADPSLRAEALYNLGNSAFRQGRLEDAVGLYKAALEVNPDDEDAKFNLEFVRDEIRRRHEEAQKRQQQQQQGQDQQQDQQQQGEEGQQGQQEEQPQDQQQQHPQPGGQDSDQDGLPDEVEQSGENPTDPQNPDSDGDSLADGAEDINRNGRVDADETDPNKVDSDGDGVPDAQEASAGGQGAEAEGQEQAGLTPEEADRYLQALEEGRPVRAQPQGGRRSRTEKDW